MASNFPGPYQIEVNYTVDSRDHIMRLNCDVDTEPTAGEDPANIDLVQRDGSTVNLGTAVNALVALFAPLYYDDASFNSYTLWKYDAGTFNRTYKSAGTLSIVGSTSGSAEPASYSQLTFGTVLGGKMSIVLIEGRLATPVKLPLSNTGSTQIDDIRDYVLSADAWMIGYDNSFAVRGINYLRGQNEALFKKYYR